MKAAYLKELLKSGYAVAYYESKEGDYIGIGNGYIHDLIHFDLNKKKIKQKNSENVDLLRIKSRLLDIITKEEFQQIINDNDEIENPITIYYEKDGEILETQCAEYGWPNTTIDGRMIYNNVYFETEMEAKYSAVKACILGIEITQDSIERELKIKKARLEDYNQRLFKLRKAKKEKHG